MSSKIKKGDIVFILVGDDKGKKGKVLKVSPKKNKAIVEGINKVKKHVKPTAENPQSGIIEKEAWIHLSNLSLIDSKTNKASRVGFKIEEGKKRRYLKKSGDLVVDEIEKRK